MGLFRRSTIFHAEDALPDPEEIKLRLRRRVLLVTLLAFLGVLGAPVVRELQPFLRGRAEARRFAEAMQQARWIAAVSRLPVALELSRDGQSWQRRLYLNGESCEREAPGPSELIPAGGVAWKLQAQKDSGEPVTGSRLCWHPSRGLMLNTVPLADAKLLVSLSGRDEAGSEQALAQVLVTQGGAEMDTISH